jgi:hypothetical protein
MYSTSRFDRTYSNDLTAGTPKNSFPYSISQTLPEKNWENGQ